MKPFILTASLLFMATTALAQTFTPEGQGVPTGSIFTQPNTTSDATWPCERLLPIVRAVFDDPSLKRYVTDKPPRRMTSEEYNSVQAWGAQCQDPVWTKRLAALAPPLPKGAQGYSRALGIVEPSRPSRFTTTTNCYGGHFTGYRCTTTTYGD